MKTIYLLFPTVILLVLTSCTSTPEEVRERQEAKTRRYSDYEEKRTIRQEARDERTELWYDRVFADENEF